MRRGTDRVEKSLALYRPPDHCTRTAHTASKPIAIPATLI
jgi:hypothetical protein